MNRYGSMDVAARAKDAPALESLKAAPISLARARVLDCRTEIAADPADALVPPALHPAIPSYGGWVVTAVDEGPFGPFALAELRIGVRVDAVGAFLVVGAVCDSEPVRKALSEGWGWRVAAGEVRLEELHHRVDATVRVDGRTVLDLTLTERRPLPGTRLNAPSLIALARVGGRPVLVNAPREVALPQADGGRWLLHGFDGAAFGAGADFRPSHPMGASYGVAEVTFGAPDFVMDADRPAEETLAAVAA